MITDQEESLKLTGSIMLILVAMQLPAMNAVFTATKNKHQLIMFICYNLLRMLIFKTATPVYTKLVVTGETESPIVIHKSVTIERVDLKTTH